MTEIINIEQIINEGVANIDSQIERYQWQINNQDKFFDWQKPSIVIAQNNINTLLKDREVAVAEIVNNTRMTVDELISKHGDTLLVVCSKEERYIGVHRGKCEHYKKFVRNDTSVFKRCSTFENAIGVAHSLKEEIKTEIASDCSECKPFWNLLSIKKSL